jgi:glycyl-tRNA synthetase (class II)
VPLVKNKEEITSKLKKFSNYYHRFYIRIYETGTIGKRYIKQDEIGTPFCITVDLIRFKICCYYWNREQWNKKESQ